MVFGADRKPSILRVWAAPAARKILPKERALRTPPFGRVFPAAWAAQTAQIDDFRSAPKPCTLSYATVLSEDPRNGPGGGPEHRTVYGVPGGGGGGRRTGTAHSVQCFGRIPGRNTTQRRVFRSALLLWAIRNPLML